MYNCLSFPNTSQNSSLSKEMFFNGAIQAFENTNPVFTVPDMCPDIMYKQILYSFNDASLPKNFYFSILFQFVFVTLSLYITIVLQSLFIFLWKLLEALTTLTLSLPARASTSIDPESNQPKVKLHSTGLQFPKARRPFNKILAKHSTPTKILLLPGTLLNWRMYHVWYIPIFDTNMMLMNWSYSTINWTFYSANWILIKCICKLHGFIIEKK